jgi:hypothetical protein
MPHNSVKICDDAKFIRRVRKAERNAANAELDLVWTMSHEIVADRATGNLLYRFMLVDPDKRLIVLGDGKPGNLYSASLEQVEAFLAEAATAVSNYGDLDSESIADAQRAA